MRVFGFSEFLEVFRRFRVLDFFRVFSDSIWGFVSGDLCLWELDVGVVRGRFFWVL